MPRWLDTLLYVLLAVGVAVFANYLAALWGNSGRMFSWLLVAVVVLSPFRLHHLRSGHYARLGVAIGSGAIDSLLSILTVGVGLVVFNEWAKLTPPRVRRPLSDRGRALGDAFRPRRRRQHIVGKSR